MNIRPATDRDGPEIAAVAAANDLLLDDLTPEIFERMLQWLYVDSPTKTRVQFVAMHDDAIVAHYGALPLLYKVMDEIWLVGFGSNLVISREHRTGMAFFSIQGHFQKLWRANGMRFAFGLVTRQNVIEPHLRAGWRLLGAIPVYAKPIRFPAIAKRLIPEFAQPLAYLPLKVVESATRLYDALRSARGERNITVDRVQDFSGLPSEFLASVMASHEIAAIRDVETLTWRFRANSDRDYRIDVATRGSRPVGYLVTRVLQMKELKTLAVVDLAIEPGDSAVADALLSHCALEARAIGADIVATILNPTSVLLPSFLRNGFLRTPEEFTLIAQAPRSTHEADILENAYKKWHVTWFDHDYV